MTDSKLQIIKEMWDQGMSLTQIGVRMKCTRNSIAGFMNRNREVFGRKRPVNAEPKPKKPTGGKKGRPARVAQPPKLKAVAESETRIRDSENQESLSVPTTPTKRFIDLSRHHECKWLMMTGFHDACTSESPVCGRAAKLGEPYCTPHMRLAYNPPQRRTPGKSYR